MNHDFRTPHRQSLVAIVLIIYKTIRVVVRQVWPFLIIVLLGGNASSYSAYLMPVVIGLSVMSMIWAVIAYFKYFFYIKNDELIIEKGVLSRTKLNIPFDRIQSVNFQQNIIHQLANVKKLEIDTAGASGSEFSMDALSVNKANALRDLILERKKELEEVSAHLIRKEQSLPTEENTSLILHLSISDLIKVGVSQNHFRSAGFIIAGIFYIISQLNEIGLGVEDKIENYIREDVVPGVNIVVLLLILFLFISFIFSLIRSVLLNYNLKLWRVGEKYKIEKGLFTRRETTAVDQKIQIMEWSDNPLKKLFNYFDIRLKQASSVKVRAASSITIPGCHPNHVHTLTQNWLKEFDFHSLNKHSVSIHYLIRRLLYNVLFGALLIGVVYLFKPQFVAISIFYTIYLIVCSVLRYRKRSFAITDHLLYIGRGIFSNHHAIMPLFKIQSVSIIQSPYESRRELASLRVMTASGHLLIPFISKILAHRLNDYLLYGIESSKRHWM